MQWEFSSRLFQAVKLTLRLNFTACCPLCAALPAAEPSHVNKHSHARRRCAPCTRRQGGVPKLGFEVFHLFGSHFLPAEGKCNHALLGTHACSRAWMQIDFTHISPAQTGTRTQRRHRDNDHTACSQRGRVCARERRCHPISCLQVNSFYVGSYSAAQCQHNDRRIISAPIISPQHLFGCQAA